VVEKLTKLLAEQGFGILTRIDFHTKMKEKLGKDMPPVVILGACNPGLAYEAFQKNTDTAGLVPCNAVVREVGAGKFSIELTKPSLMMEMMGETEMAAMAAGAELLTALNNF
jgi:uncharacterized protein (DUF302 family)